MASDWQVLKSPPVILAIFQLKFSHCSDEALGKMIANDRNIKLIYKKRHISYHADINFPGTLVPGESSFKGNTKVESYTYTTEDNLRKLRIEKDSIVVVNEGSYLGWENFKLEVMDCLNLLSEQLKECSVNRVSIRFINKFTFDSFEDPLDYFSQMISTESVSRYPLLKYSFRLNVVIPDTDIQAIINNASEPNNEGKSDYYLDIDVLSHTLISFDLSLISDQMENIREVKNNIFFDTVKQKTLELCN